MPAISVQYIGTGFFLLVCSFNSILSPGSYLESIENQLFSRNLLGILRTSACIKVFSSTEDGDFQCKY